MLWFFCCCCCSVLVVPLFNIYLFIYFYLTLLFCFFFLLPCLFVLLCLLYSLVGTLIWPCFLLCVLVRFVFNSLISFLGSFAHQSTLLYLIFLGLFWSPLCVCVCLCSFVFVSTYLILLLPFVCFFFWLFFSLFNPLYCHDTWLMRSWFPWSPSLQADSLPSKPPGKPTCLCFLQFLSCN